MCHPTLRSDTSDAGLFDGPDQKLSHVIATYTLLFLSNLVTVIFGASFYLSTEWGTLDSWAHASKTA